MKTHYISMESENLQKIRQLYAKTGQAKNRTPFLSGSSVL